MNDYFRVFGTARNALVAVHFGFRAVFLLVAAPEGSAQPEPGNRDPQRAGVGGAGDQLRRSAHRVRR